MRSRTEVVPSVLPFTEVVPKNAAQVGADRSEQPQKLVIRIHCLAQASKSQC